MERVIRPIATIETDFDAKFGIPRQSGRAPSLLGRIVFFSEYRVTESLRGIEEFSHLWLLFDFSQSHRDTWSPTVRPPRLGGNKRVGVFASRSPFRPNGIGLSCVKLERVEHTADDGDVLIVSGVDLLNGTPIYDIKPYLPYADAPQGAVGGYADAHQSHRLNVIISDDLLLRLPPEKRAGALECLADDPRPSYQDDDREYAMSFGGFDIRFSVRDTELTVTDIVEK